MPERVRGLGTGRPQHDGIDWARRRGGGPVWVQGRDRAVGRLQCREPRPRDTGRRRRLRGLCPHHRPGSDEPVPRACRPARRRLSAAAKGLGYTACGNVVVSRAGGGHLPTFRLGRVGVEVDVEALVRPVVEGSGLELFDVVYDRSGGRRILRVTVDRDGGLDLDTIASTSDKIARRLDLEGFGEGRYELEVSSPGIEHPLKTAAQFTRAVGTTVKVRTASAIDDARVHA